MSTELTEIPEVEKFKGKLFKNISPVEYEPKDVYDKIDLPKEMRSIFVIKPLSKRQNHIIESDMKIASQMAIKWAISIGIKIKTIAQMGQNQLDVFEGKEPKYRDSDGKRTDYQLFSAKMASLCDPEIYSDIARENIVDIKGGVYEYVADIDGKLDRKIFDTIHDDIIESISREIQRISKLSSIDTVGL